MYIKQRFFVTESLFFVTESLYFDSELLGCVCKSLTTRETTMENITVEWDDRAGTATGFTTRPQATRFIEQVCKKAAPDKIYRIINKLESWQNCETRQH